VNKNRYNRVEGKMSYVVWHTEKRKYFGGTKWIIRKMFSPPFQIPIWVMTPAEAVQFSDMSAARNFAETKGWKVEVKEIKK